MATLLRIRGKRAILPSLRTVQSLMYCTEVLNSSKDDHHSDTRSISPTASEGEWSIPMVPKRDPDAVLKALTSTVEPVEVPLYMRGRGIADPLYPRGRGYHMDFVQHLEAGRAAARSIINRWPALFPHKPTDPSPAERSLAAKPPLERLIAKRRASKAWRLYLTMKKQGEEVPLSTENSLLALVAYEGLGNTLSASEDLTDTTVKWPKGRTTPRPLVEDKPPVTSSEDEKSGTTKTLEEESGESTDVTAETKKQNAQRLVATWSMNNVPEVMFSKMDEKNGGTYDALIQGLIRFNRYGRAFDMFQEMRDKGFQANRGTYNLLLSALTSYQVFNVAKSLVEHMNSEPVVQPDIRTMNHLLRISTKLGSSTKTVSLQIMREIFHLGLEPTLTTFYHLLTGLASDMYGTNNHERAMVLEQVVEYIEANEHLLTLREETDMVFFVQAFSTVQKIGSADLALRLKALADTNHYFLIDNLNLVMSKYLSTLVRHATMDTVMEEYYKLVPKTFVPLEWLYREMFTMCDKHQSAQTALKLWQHTQRFIVPLYKTDTWNSFCAAVSHYIPQEDAQSYITALDQVESRFRDAKIKPSDMLLTAMVRAHTQNGNLDEAWMYYNRLKSPSFLALVALLKKHNSLGDKKKVVEILEEMVRLKMYLPLRYVKDMLWSAGLDEKARHSILDGLSKNKMEVEEERLVLELENSEHS